MKLQQIIHGGEGHDDDLTAFGDTLYTIFRLYKLSRFESMHYRLEISASVKNGAEHLYGESGYSEWNRGWMFFIRHH